MKIALIHRYYPMMGGVTTVVDALKKEFEKNNIPFEIITQQKTRRKNVTCLPSKSSIVFYFKAFNYIRKNSFDVIHSQSSFIGFFKPFLKQKILLSVQGFEKSFDKGSLKKYIVETFYGKLKIPSYYLADKLIATSKMISEDLIKKYKINPKKVCVLPNPVDTEFFRPMKVRRKDKKIRISQYGTNNRKGFHLVKKWVRKLSKDNKNIKVVVFGNDRPKDFDRDLDDYFEFLGGVDISEVPRIYNSCDFTLLASLYDPFGLTAGESMACGRPAIVSKFAGVKDSVIDGYGGFVCDLDDFPSKMSLLINDRSLLKKMSGQARDNAVRIMSSRAIAERHIREYKKMLSTSSHK